MKSLYIKNPGLLNDRKKVVIYGISEDSVLTFTMLMQNEVYVHAFVCEDDSKKHLSIMNKKVITIKSIETSKEEYIVVVGGDAYNKVAEKLECQGFEVFYDFNLPAYKGNCIQLQEEQL